MNEALKFLPFQKQERREVKGPKDILRLPSAERPEALRSFKEQLITKKESLAEAQEKMFNIIRENPDLSAKELYKLASSFIKEKFAAFDKVETRVIKSFFYEYEVQHRQIRKARKKFSDDAKLFRFIFGKKPKGEIRVTEGPVMLMFQCFTLDDYTWAHEAPGGFISQRLFNSPTQEEAEERAKLSGGAVINDFPVRNEFRGAVAIENATMGHSPEQSKIIFIHEERHLYHRMLQKALRLEQFFSRFPELRKEETHQEYFQRYFRFDFRKKSDYIKNELISYLATGESPWNIIRFLLELETEKGLYDYFIKDRKELINKFSKKAGKDDISLVKNTVEGIFRSEYERFLRENIGAFLALRQRGYSLEKAISLLTVEPLWRWRKIVQRITGEYPEPYEFYWSFNP